jgi:hypothetical protein
MAIGAPQAIKMRVGGKTSNGPSDGVYRVVVADASVGVAKRTGRPYIALEFHGKGDQEHPSINGKKLITAKFYGASETDDPEKAQKMNGMLKNRLYRGFGLPWPKEPKDLDPRIFLKKEVYILLGQGKPNEQGETYPEVKAIALKKDQLPKAFGKNGKADENEPNAED